jgi:hypothetical protein
MLRFAAVDSKSMLEPRNLRSSSSQLLGRLRLFFLVGSTGALGILSASFALSGCAADLEADPSNYTAAQLGPQPRGCDIPTVMKASCWGIGCHGKDLAASMLDMESPGVEMRMVNVPASYGDILDGTAANCAPGGLRIDGANPDNSVVLKKLYGDHTCGGKMPVAPRTVTPAQIECIRDWVWILSTGALPTGAYTPGATGGGGTGGAGGTAGTGGTGGTAGTGGDAGGTAGTGGTDAGGTAGTGGTDAGGTAGGGTGGV